MTEGGYVYIIMYMYVERLSTLNWTDYAAVSTPLQRTKERWNERLTIGQVGWDANFQWINWSWGEDKEAAPRYCPSHLAESLLMTSYANNRSIAIRLNELNVTPHFSAVLNVWFSLDVLQLHIIYSITENLQYSVELILKKNL